ncbi:cysteinyl leukotriene receptor 1-like [Stegostoma tigrinum]|uniref:cysteinyl leukotriene receptor 1-like n=1 Tax=Stegostoma tigrinum TaxID=3053191 RepID=UPI00202B1F89|nr:cysteinyl leukotriene receptor 1-like [Stegostoma tigrinum]XP_059506027.1 cysteinyl leukotriene receptor 1-like [Stegostoma tigrinum]
MNNTSIWRKNSCENNDTFKTNIYLPTYIIVFIFGFIENVFCLYVFLKLYKRKTAIGVVTVNLAISDLLFVCTLPWRVHYYLNNGKWNLPHSLCAFMSYALYLNMYCSIYFLTLMSVLRYFAIVHPMNALKYRSVKSVQIVCVAIWIFVGITASPFLTGGSYINKNNETKCFHLKDGVDYRIFVMNLISLVVGCIVPFFIIIICYTLVVKALLISKAKHHQKMSSLRKAIALIIIVMVIFLTSFLPYHILRTVHVAINLNVGHISQASCFIQKCVVVTQCGAAINSCLDPLLYYFAAETFRGKVKTTANNIFKCVMQRS